MARYKGHDGSITAGGDAIGEIESFDIEVSTNELMANVMGSDWTDREAGQNSATGTIAVLSDPGDTGQSNLTVGASVALVLFSEGNSSGLTEISGNFQINSIGISTSVGDLVKRTYSIANKGTVTIGAVV